jgi:hypothetical protein
MLVLRFMLVLGAIAIAVTFGVYLFTRDARYLRFAVQISKLILIVFVIVMLAWAMGRIILF